MTWHRRTRLITAVFALISLLFMQLAVASYTCPGTGSKIAEVAAKAEAGMPCAESMSVNMDDVQPNLCQAHCQAGQQSADKHELPSPVAIGALPADFSLQVAIPVFLEAPLQAPHLQRTTAPPVAIRNCCFRL
jgi:type IV secretory pathway VirJ component